ncbi:MAG: hypothetical protein IKK17_00370, partial [Oscillospiraceae bacterium]|nr:hypothetical protein [Oscillospiraceae bacterium]
MAKKSETTTAAKKKTTDNQKTNSTASKKNNSSAGTKKASSNTSKSSKSSSNAKSTKGKAKEPVKNPIRREIGGVICILLGLLCFIGYFEVEAAFFVLTDVMKGLIGYGYQILPFCILWAGVVLLTHRGRPVALRVTAILLLSLLWGILGHVLVFGVPLSMELGIVEVCSVLYSSGLGMHSGGAVAGLLAFTLEKTVSVFGAVPVVLILMIFFLFVGANMTPRRLIETIRARQPYDPDVYDDEEYIPAPVVRPAAKPAKKQVKRAPDAAELLMLAETEDFSGMIDIPLD